MKSEITISELAKLMNVSVHQIRYFEEKGVLLPSYTEDNQYRRYGIDQIYQLAHIMLLRKLGLPVQNVKECMTDFGPDEVRQMLQNSLEDTQSEILRLQQLEQFIGKVLHEHDDFSQDTTAYRVVRRESVNLKRWFELNEQSALQARQLAEYAKPALNLFEADIHYVYEGTGSAVLCTEVTEATETVDLVLAAGEYLCSPFQVSREDELAQQIVRFGEYAAEHAYISAGPLILIEKSYLSLFSQDKLHYELLQRMVSA
ncbi:MerR family transcriptional regulator [Paenibacillus sp. P46E]|uniref:MerR family transcriptional regulator n=1 Tax=Paenibacillus sp. P46E TaxID=1349436 RepID=UPI00093A0296|nr:MerR family transcriptional regulator [Paenibacillus sp. P46E]OKP97176.1 transcriptional regulator [Paenibacillus sp. P46E]